VSKRIENSTDCEVQAGILFFFFLSAPNVQPIEIYSQLTILYAEGEMKKSNIIKQWRMFKEGRTNVHNDERSGCQSLLTEGFFYFYLFI
jgi:hypothetical protein